MLISKLNQSFRAEGKKECLKQFARHLCDGILLFLVLVVGLFLGIKLIKYLGAFSFIVLNIQTRRLHHLLDLSDSSPNSW